MTINVRPLSRLLAVSGAGGLLGALVVGGPIGLFGGLLLGGFAEEVFARASTGKVGFGSEMGRERRRHHGSPMGSERRRHLQPGAEYSYSEHLQMYPPEEITPERAPYPSASWASLADGDMPNFARAFPGATGFGSPMGWEGKRHHELLGSFGAATTATGLKSGQKLAAGQHIASPSGAYVLTMQADGDLVLGDQDGITVWSSNTAGSGGTAAMMQPDGNLVITAPGQPSVWSSGTGGQPGSRLTVHDDGNLVVYSPMGLPAWSSNTAQASS